MVYEIIQIPESFPSQNKSLNAKEFKLHTLHDPPGFFFPPRVQALVSRKKKMHVKFSKFGEDGSKILTQCPDFHPSHWKVRLENSQRRIFPTMSSDFINSSLYCRSEAFSLAGSHLANPDYGILQSRGCLQDSTLERPSFPEYSSESLIRSRCMPCSLHSGLRINGHLKAH